MQKFAAKTWNTFKYLYGIFIIRDPFLLEARRWFKDRGDETLRLSYPLSGQSVVFDIGGYRGDFAAEINERYGCKVYVFEPVKEFHDYCVARFKNNSDIICLNYGLAAKDAWLDIGLAENASSFSSPFTVEKRKLRVEVRSINEVINKLGLGQIDLLKINIEGGEFDVLPALIESKNVGNINYLQIQFHNFMDRANERRDEIRALLQQTHSEMWNYPFIWESWKSRSGVNGAVNSISQSSKL